MPIVFVVEGIAAQLFRDQALTVTISLLASLVVAVTLIPMLSSLGSKDRVAPERSAAAGEEPLMTLGAFSRGYDSVVRGAIRHRWFTLVLALGLFFSCLAAARRVGTELIPPLSEGEFFVELNLPEGASLAATDRIIQRMERAAENESAVERSYSTVGSRLVAGGLSLNTRGENLGQLNVVMKDRSDAGAEARTAATLREQFRDLPDVEVKFGRPSYFSLRTPIEVIVFGENLDELRSYSLTLARRLAAIDGLVDVRSSLEAGNPELQVIFDRRRLASLGLEMNVLSDTLRSRVQGTIPTRFREKDRQIDIRIRNLEEFRASTRDVEELVLPGPDGQPIRLLTVADVIHARGPAEIHRVGQQRAAVISANLKGRSLGGAIADVEAAVRSMPRPEGLSGQPELGGQNRDMKVSFVSLRHAIALAVFLVYLVMAATFESFLHPFIVLFTIPLSLIGVVLGLLGSGSSISVLVLIGGVMLVGIVVNNAIVLIDTINRLRRSGLEKEVAVVRAGHIRLRPILMTTLTTILGLLPMALGWGEGAELRSPLAITVASGLFFSTLLTLVVIPAAYMALPSRIEAAEMAVVGAGSATGARDPGATGGSGGDDRAEEVES